MRSSDRSVKDEMLGEIQRKGLIQPFIDQRSAIENVASDETIKIREVRLWYRNNKRGSEEIWQPNADYIEGNRGNASDSISLRGP